MGDFEDKNFPDAVDSADVGWMCVEWRIRREDNRCSDCGPNYSLNSNQFEEMPLATTRAEAIENFRKFKRNRRQHIGTRDASPRRVTLFLLKVVKVANITDDDRNLLTDTEIDV